MKLREVANIIQGTYLKNEKGMVFEYREITMASLEPISFIDERKLILTKSTTKVAPQAKTRAGDVVVSLYYPMTACYVDENQEGLVVPHYMAIIRLKPNVRMDSRFVVQFINSNRGRKALSQEIYKSYSIQPSVLPLNYLNNVNILTKEVLLESY